MAEQGRTRPRESTYFLAMHLPMSVYAPVLLLFPVPFSLSLFTLHFPCLSLFLTSVFSYIYIFFSQFPFLSLNFFPWFPVLPHSFHLFLCPFFLHFLTSFLPTFSLFSLHSLPLISLLYIFSLTFSLSMSVKLSYPFLFNPLHPILSLFISVTSSSFLSPSSHSLPFHICLSLTFPLFFFFIIFPLPSRPSPCLSRSPTYSFLICVRASPLTEMFPSLMWS